VLSSMMLISWSSS